jgi:DNA-binding protein HU-beta
MRKAELVTRMAQAAKLTKRQAEKTLHAFLNAAQEALSTGERVTVVGIGTFAVQSRAAHRRRHSRTGVEIIVPARKKPTFREGKRLRVAIGGRTMWVTQA